MQNLVFMKLNFISNNDNFCVELSALPFNYSIMLQIIKGWMNGLRKND